VKIAVLQPSYLPWLGYLEQIASVDAFVFYDDVQFDKNGWRNRNRIRVDTPQGWAWLTIPVLPQGFPSISDVRTDPRVPWRRKHRASVQASYARAPRYDCFERYFGAFYDDQTPTKLAEIAIENIRCLMRAFDIRTPLHRSSTLGVTGDRNTRLLRLCEHFGTTCYISGAAAKDYLDTALFARAGVEVRWQAYEHPSYAQRFSPFISHLSALDALLNLGEDAGALIRRNDTNECFPSKSGAPRSFPSTSPSSATRK